MKLFALLMTTGLSKTFVQAITNICQINFNLNNLNGNGAKDWKMSKETFFLTRSHNL